MRVTRHVSVTVFCSALSVYLRLCLLQQSQTVPI